MLLTSTVKQGNNCVIQNRDRNIIGAENRGTKRGHLETLLQMIRIRCYTYYMTHHTVYTHRNLHTHITTQYYTIQKPISPALQYIGHHSYRIHTHVYFGNLHYTVITYYTILYCTRTNIHCTGIHCTPQSLQYTHILTHMHTQGT